MRPGKYLLEFNDPAVDVNSTNTEDNKDSFTYTVKDATGNMVTGTITVDIIDDVPTANSNTRTAVEGVDLTGNVLTDGTADVFGADGAAVGGGVVGVRTAGNDLTTAVTSGTGSVIQGQFGTLTLNANGSYSYNGTPNSVGINGGADVFVYTIKDGDGDLSTTTLTINVSDSGLAVSNDNITVNEAALPIVGSNPGSPAETASGTVVGDVQHGLVTQAQWAGLGAQAQLPVSWDGPPPATITLWALPQSYPSFQPVALQGIQRSTTCHDAYPTTGSCQPHTEPAANGASAINTHPVKDIVSHIGHWPLSNICK